MRILLFGKNGQVGWELRRSMLPLGDILALDFPDIDFESPESLRGVINGANPDIIVNCAAYTAVDKAEAEEELAMCINADAVSVIADEARKRDALLIHYSTDYVFDGAASSPYTEDNFPNPVNAYGRSKLSGDLAIQSSGCRHLIFRSSWIYGRRGHNFLLTMLRIARERRELKIVDDQIGAPTWSRLLADVTTLAVQKMFSLPDRGVALSGLYNITNYGSASWYEFALEIFSRAGAVDPNLNPHILPIPSEAYPLPAKRPLNSRLNNDKICQTFGFQMPDWKSSLNLCMEELM